MINNSFYDWYSPSITPLLEDQTHVWAADFEQCYIHLEQLYTLLPADERERANSYKFSKDRSTYIISKAILRKLIAQYTGIQPAAIKFCYSSYGKPYLPKNVTQLFFNVSHSKDLILYIFNNQFPVGIDIEYIKYIENIEHLARQFFAPAEIAHLASINFQEKTFYNYWTQKEAFVKAIGEGLSHPLDQFEVSLSDKKIKILSNSQTIPKICNWQIESLIPAKNYSAAFVICGADSKRQFFKYEL